MIGCISQFEIYSSSAALVQRTIAAAAECSPRSVTTIRSNLRQFGDTRAPSIGAGRPHSITPLMLEALCDHRTLM
ncbi:Probable transposable element [Penicillium roqueforti FM164]|uniref:Probable transposable element n=1 Tax=Penicillium roqueforti (strain FM164) TaxID=1365484 RepID=W6QNC7_PENRF|nr:Probable transposable element [Penicillium roqueforti FM164]